MKQSIKFSTYLDHHADFPKQESGQYWVMNCLGGGLHSQSALVQQIMY